MKVLLVGCGKMGKLILDEIQKSGKADSLTVCDIKFDREYVSGGVLYTPSLSSALLTKPDCAFVASPAETHAAVLERLLGAGIRNVYSEKPLVVNAEEYDRVAALKGDARLAVGYILRQSQAASEARKRFDALLLDGFYLESCRVVYQKYLPASLEERAQHDLGVFDEVVHVWDLIFNYFGLRSASVISESAGKSEDPHKKGRCIFAEMAYTLLFEGRKVDLDIYASFLERQRRREFSFLFKNALNEERELILEFDTDDAFDVFRMIGGGTEMICEKYPSLVKLSNQLDQVFRYFETGDCGDLAVPEDTEEITLLMKNAC